MNQMKGFSRVNRFIALLLAISFLVLGTVSSVSAAVTTASGDPIIGAFVKLVDYPQYNATTDGLGDYDILNVPYDGLAGGSTYSISASKEGYVTNLSTVTVTGYTVTKDFTLSIGIPYYLPFLYQRADNIYDAGVKVHNNGTTVANIDIQFYYLNGTSAGIGTFTIQPGALLTKHAFDIVKGQTVFVGPAVVLSDVPVQVEGYIKTVNEDVYSIAPSLKDAASNSYVPFLYQRADNIYDAGVMVFNPGSVSADVTITMYNLDGSIAGSGTYTVAPKAEVSKYAFDIVTGKSVFVGPAEITSTQPIVAQGFIRTKASMIYSIAPSVSTAVLNAYLPFLYQRADNIYDAGVMVYNPGPGTASVTINMYNLDGTLAGSGGPYTVAPKSEVSKYAFDIVTGKSQFVGPAEIISIGQPVVSQGFIRTKASMVYSIAPQVRKPVAASDTHVPFLYQTVSATHDAGIMAMNPNSVSANVGITLYYPDGSIAGSYSQTVAPYAELSKYSFDIASGIRDFNGSAIVTSNQPIVSQGFIRKKSSMIYSIAPPMER